MQRQSSSKKQKRSEQQKIHAEKKESKVVSTSNHMQNLKQFKMEIDQEIAKCLDTLDRQGLKYLRQTLKASTIFANQQIQQDIIAVHPLCETKIPTKRVQKQISEEIQQEIPQNLAIEDIEDENDQYEEHKKVIAESQTKNIPSNKNNYQEIKNKQANAQIDLAQFKVGKQINQHSRPFGKFKRQKENNKQLVQASQQANQKVQRKQAKVSQLQNSQDHSKSQIDQLVDRIVKLSPKKIQKLEKILEKIEFGQDKLSEQSNCKQPYLLKQGINKCRDIAYSSRISKNNSRSRFAEKASSIYPTIMKNKNNSYDSQNVEKEQQLNEDIKQDITIQIPDNENIPYSQILQNQSEYFTEKKSEQKFVQSGILPKLKLLRKQSTQKNPVVTQMKVNFSPHSSKIENQQNPSKISLTLKLNPLIRSQYQEKKQLQHNFEEKLQQSQTRMVRINKKKTAPTCNILFKIIGNRGHPSMVGLTAIEIFNSRGQLIDIQNKFIKQPANSQKIMVLFNQSKKTIDSQNMWVGVLNDGKAQIQIQIPSRIQLGGIRIWNFNKSQLQSSKQVDTMEIWVNKEKSWEGTIRNGAYNQFEDYYTQIALTPSFSVKEQKQEQNFMKSPTKISKQQKTQWLQKTLIEDKLKQIQREEQKEPTQESQRKANNNSIRSLTNIKKEDPLDLISETLKKLNKQQNFKIIKPSKFAKVDKNINNQIDIFAEFKKPQTRQNAKLPDPADINPKKQQKMDSLLWELQKPIKNIAIIENTKEPQVIKKQQRLKINDWDIDFMNDSYFKDPIQPKKQENQQKIINPKRQQKILYPSQQQQKPSLDQFIQQLNGMMGLKTQTHSIPQLPSLSNLDICLMKNWGDQNYIGLNGIQIFNIEGDIVLPNSMSVDNQKLSYSAISNIFSGSYMTSDQGSQWKVKLKPNITINLTFKSQIKLSLIRIWNFNGHRVHSNVGVKNCSMKSNGKIIFQGEIRKSLGCAQDAYKFVECILFTNNQAIFKKIKEKDWLSSILNRQKQQTKIFKETLSDFKRPNTKNETDDRQNEANKNSDKIVIQIKLPKRICNQYQPPKNPIGYRIKIILHSTWGDNHFIGLNGIEVFDHKGKNLLKNSSDFSIVASPASINTLIGYEGDQRVAKNLINGQNLSKADRNIWLAPFLSGVDRIENNHSNQIIIDFLKPYQFSGINFYNYSKTPARGVRQIEIFIDYYLVYRGYLKQYKQNEPTHTTVNFTKDLSILQQIKYCNYHEDNLFQEVGLINQGKVLKKALIQPMSQMQRPLTGQRNKQF